jgi:hypothetical protein
MSADENWYLNRQHFFTAKKVVTGRIFFSQTSHIHKVEPLLLGLFHVLAVRSTPVEKTLLSYSF